MSTRTNTRCTRTAQILALAICAAISGNALADTAQNSAVQGDKASLTAAGFGNLDGTGINVGIVEADDAFANAFYGNGAANVTAPNSTLVNGNPDLPGARMNFPQLPANGGNPAGQLPRGANAGNFPNANFSIGNHASEVTGVVMGQGVSAAADLGIAPGAGVQFAARDNLGLGGGNTAAGQNDSAATIQTIAQQINTPVVNMSWGTPPGNTIVGPNGTSVVTRFVDWAATNYDKLMVVAGNEGGPGIPSDSYNSINVAASGARGFYNNGKFQIGAGAVLNYGIAANYNSSNITTNVSPITGYGRIKTDIIAPGGNPTTPATSAHSMPRPPSTTISFRRLPVASTNTVRPTPAACHFTNRIPSTVAPLRRNTAWRATTPPPSFLALPSLPETPVPIWVAAISFRPAASPVPALPRLLSPVRRLCSISPT